MLVQLDAGTQPGGVAPAPGVADPLGADEPNGGAHAGAGAVQPEALGTHFAEAGVGGDGLAHHHGGGALALHVEPAADGVFGVLGPPGFDVLREGAGVGVGDAEPLPPGLVAEAKQVPDDVVDVHLHAVGGKDIVPGDVFGPGVAQVQLRQQRRIQGAQRGLPVAQLAAEAFAGALPGAVHLAGGLAVGVEYLNLAHAITPASPRRRGRAVPVSTSRRLM